MADILRTIMSAKHDEVAALKQRYSSATLDEMAAAAPKPRGFTKALLRASKNGYGLIAELKKLRLPKGL